MDIAALLLRTGLTAFIDEPGADAAFDRFRALAGGTLDAGAFHDAVAACVRDGLIREPLRLDDHSLHCHWRLVLTPEGVARARILTGA
ncbi:MAG: hypothetical protein BGP12_19380 [Rhodospirillales bacterium 70-18]|mgnify:CR=1 FL=1|nr:hypothetical protein [Rhodospirillales bacterium]OJY65353.1 MAG: hypothetical protein BGP12_19380 [Rhodospirillales bacterium 70-18]